MILIIFVLLFSNFFVAESLKIENNNFKIVYNNFEQYNDYYKNHILYENRERCETDDYKIHVFMSSDIFSGTDDKVDVRLYSGEKKTTEWFQLDTPRHNDFERLSTGTYCMESDTHNFFRPEKIGILKDGSDKMKIFAIRIDTGRQIFFVEDIEQWIEKPHEYVFNVTSYNFF